MATGTPNAKQTATEKHGQKHGKNAFHKFKGKDTGKKILRYGTIALSLTLAQPAVMQTADQLFFGGKAKMGQIFGQTVTRAEVDKWLSYRFTSKNVSKLADAAIADNGVMLLTIKNLPEVGILTKPGNMLPLYVGKQLDEIGITHFSEKARVEYAGVAKWNEVDCNIFYVWDVGAKGIICYGDPIDKKQAVKKDMFYMISVTKFLSPVTEDTKFMLFPGGIVFNPNNSAKWYVEYFRNGKSYGGTVDLNEYMKDHPEKAKVGYDPLQGGILFISENYKELVAYVPSTGDIEYANLLAMK